MALPNIVDLPELDASPISYSVPLRFRHSAADASGSFIWAMRNSTAKAILLRRFVFVVGFDGTAAASESEYELVRLSGISADSGGTLRTPALRRTTQPASSVTSVRDNAVLTLTGAAVADTLAAFGSTRQVGASNMTTLIWAPAEAPALEPSAGVAFALRLNAAAVIGDWFRGIVEWEER